jgi:hypothetical protein
LRSLLEIGNQVIELLLILDAREGHLVATGVLLFLANVATLRRPAAHRTAGAVTRSTVRMILSGKGVVFLLLRCMSPDLALSRWSGIGAEANIRDSAERRD